LPDLRLGDLALGFVPLAHARRCPPSLDAQERARAVPVAALVAVNDALIDDQLPVLRQRDTEPLQRARRRPFEVDPSLAKAAAMTRALELFFPLQPARRAAEMRALGEQRVEAVRLADDPHPLLLLEALAHFADRVFAGQPGLEGARRREQHARERRAHEGQQ